MQGVLTMAHISMASPFTRSPWLSLFETGHHSVKVDMGYAEFLQLDTFKKLDSKCTLSGLFKRIPNGTRCSPESLFPTSTIGIVLAGKAHLSRRGDHALANCSGDHEAKFQAASPFAALDEGPKLKLTHLKSHQ